MRPFFQPINVAALTLGVRKRHLTYPVTAGSAPTARHAALVTKIPRNWSKMALVTNESKPQAGAFAVKCARRQSDDAGNVGGDRRADAQPCAVAREYLKLGRGPGGGLGDDTVTGRRRGRRTAGLRKCC
jgi:hypothetical protein